MKAIINTQLPCSAEAAWEAVLKRDTFLYVTRGLLGFTNTDEWPERFHEGIELETHLKFFHLIPGWTHNLTVTRIDADNHILQSEEGGGFVRAWHHKITINAIAENKCEYTDEIEIRAGFLTILVWLFAHIFYRYRQARWRKLARELKHT